ncbi:hypothetical protein SAMN04488506_0593 [Desemzia incerta]|uniref:Uncharacterized protein n=1 Tax=Desemzia incerta TaxID=82801 RepID=A0A1I5VU87_9LACT|nr:hypothetical protein [Desemzia incerta]SFQ11035.1 hypothetical protein SAMN04488506_0593 [Desemzia incerta]
MSNTYLIAKTSNFNRNYSIDPNVQTSLLDADGLAITEGDPETRMQHSTNIQVDNKDVAVYTIHHDYKVKKTGKVFDRIFHYYLDPKDFYLYYVEAESLLLVRAQKDVAKDFLSYLSQEFPNFKYEILEPNLKTIMSKVDGLKGAWISVVKDGVNTEAYFGSEVENDDDVREGIDNEKATYITFIYLFADKEIYCGISKKGNITLYDDSLTDDEKQVIIMRIYEHLIK